MMKLSLVAMVVLTVLIAIGLRWREQRAPQVARRERLGVLARGRKGVDRWVTAAALAAVVTLLIFGGVNWLRVWTGG